MCPTCHRSPESIHAAFPSVIYFPCTFLCLFYTHTFFQKRTRYGSLGRKSVRCWNQPYPAYSPWGYYLCYLWVPAGFLPSRLSWNARRPGPAWHSLTPPPPFWPGLPFRPSTIFKTAGIQSKHFTAQSFLRPNSFFKSAIPCAAEMF